MYSDHEMALLLYSRHAIIVLSFLDIRQHLSSFQIQIVKETSTESLMLIICMFTQYLSS